MQDRKQAQYKKILKIIFKVLFAILLIGTAIHLSIEPLYTPTAIAVGRDLYHFPKIISHGGISDSRTADLGIFHEGIVSEKYRTNNIYIANTLAAIQNTLSSTVDGIDVDIRLSKDNIPFLFKADNLEDLTNGHGMPENYTWAELSKLRYKDSQQSRIISLSEFFELTGSQKKIILYIKHRKIFNSNFAKSIINHINKYNLKDSVFVESFNPVFLAQMRYYDKSIMLMYSFVENAQADKNNIPTQFSQIPWILRQPWIQKQVRRFIRPDVLGPRSNNDLKTIYRLIKAKYPIISWNVNDEKTAKLLYDIGVVGLVTTNPTAIQAALNKRYDDANNSMQLSQKTLYDAGGTQTQIYKLIHVNSQADIVQAIKEAKEAKKPNDTKKHITIAGRRHSMGGQTLLKNSIHLNMLPFNKIKYNLEKQTITAQSGATWSQVQQVANKYNRSVKVMQSDSIFSVGGSVSVNVHGWQVGSEPLGSTILGLKLIDANGEIQYLSRTTNQELFRAVIGGYGVFGVITEVELETTPNSMLQFNSAFFYSKELEKQKLDTVFDKTISQNQNTELAYMRLSVDQNNLFNEAGVFWFKQAVSSSDMKQTDIDYKSLQTENPITENPIQGENLIPLKRAVFRLSQYHNAGKKLRWFSEKAYSMLVSNKQVMSRNNAMNSDIHILWPLYGNSKDILHEYFIPKHLLSNFIQKLKENILKYKINILNVTIREVKKDTLSLLPYATENMFALVCLFSQDNTRADEENMQKFTKANIDDALALHGNFYLPYRLHYTKQQLLKAYPNIRKWISLKQKYDPDNLFSNEFYEYIVGLVNQEF